MRFFFLGLLIGIVIGAAGAMFYSELSSDASGGADRGGACWGAVSAYNPLWKCSMPPHKRGMCRLALHRASA
jgi:hypothetical protein